MSLRFLGEWGLIKGLIIGLLAGGAVWALYYRDMRENKSLLRTLLPTLRAIVVFLIVMMLTGPVLHTRRTVGELVRLLVLLDGSESMSADDRNMDPGRKLMIAASLGWLPEDLMNRSLQDASKCLRRAEDGATEALSSGAKGEALEKAVTSFVAEIENAESLIPESEEKADVVVDEKGKVLIEYWNGVAGVSVQDLKKFKDFPNKPSRTTLSELFESPKNLGDNYGTRVSGYIHPPVTGDYFFWISGDDESELYLSRDEDPKKKQKIARVPGYSLYQDWDMNRDQKSGKRKLEGGKRYYIEALSKEGGGDDHVSVGWQLPDGTMERPIPGSRLSAPDAASEAEGNVREKFSRGILADARALKDIDAGSEREKLVEGLRSVVRDAGAWQKGLDSVFARQAAETARSDNDEVRSALARFDKFNRWQRLQAVLLEGGEPVLDAFALQHDTELITVRSGQPEVLWSSRAGGGETSGEAPKKIGVKADGPFTDVSAPLRSVTGAESGGGEDGQKTVVLLISDGRHNRGESPGHVSKVLGSRGVRVFTVGVGGTTPHEDLAVAGVDGQKSVYFKDSAKGMIVLKDHMPHNKPFVLKVECDGEILWEQDMVTQGTAERKIPYDFPIEELVKKKIAKMAKGVTHRAVSLEMKVTASAIEGDQEPANNETVMHLLAVLQKRRALMLEGRPRWEWRYIRTMLERDEQWELTSILADSRKSDGGIKRGDKPGEFPADRETLYSYDIIILGELPSRLLKDEEQEWMKDFVGNRGGGIVLLDGQRKHLRKYAEGPLGELMPVEYSGEDRKEGTAFKLGDGASSVSAFDLSTVNKTSDVVWASLHVPKWLAGVKAMPGTETMVECVYEDDSSPAVVIRRFGSGKVFYCAFEESWRWRYKVADEYHHRYWNHVASWVMEEPFAVHDERVSLDAGGMTFEPGDSPQIRVRFRDEKGRIITKAKAKVHISREGKQVATIPLSADEKGGVFRAKSAELEGGAYELRVSCDEISDRDIKATLKFTVDKPESIELTDTTCSEDLLKRMAVNGKGSYHREEDIRDLVEELKPLSHGKVIESDSPLWQSWWWFVPVILLLTVEWVLRKYGGLI